MDRVDYKNKNKCVDYKEEIERGWVNTKKKKMGGGEMR